MFLAVNEISMTSSLTLSNESNVEFSRPDPEGVDKYYISGEYQIKSQWILKKPKYSSIISDILVPILLMVALLIANAVIVWVLFRLKRKQNEAKNTESNVPLNCGTNLQTSV